jgi:quinol monooxygenase YgiN
MTHFIAVITAKPGQREVITTRFRANVPAVRAENGCIKCVVETLPTIPPPPWTAWYG